MRETVHILATVRKAALLPAALLVFRTLRTGFPFAEVRVWGNDLDPESAAAVRRAARACAAHFENRSYSSHDVWIESAVLNLDAPFWIVDTDVVFTGPMGDGGRCGEEFAGRFEPEFIEPTTGMTHVERLHTAVMWIDPRKLRAGMRACMGQVLPPWRNSGLFPFVRQTFLGQRGGRGLFFDTMAGCWQSGMGRPFSELENSQFEHLHAATYVDQLNPELGRPLARVHQEIYARPERAQGLRQAQDEYYRERGVESVEALKRKEQTRCPTR